MPEAKPETMKVGDLWLIQTKKKVEINRPDGITTTHEHRNGHVSHVLDIPGTYTCGDLQVTAE